MAPVWKAIDWAAMAGGSEVVQVLEVEPVFGRRAEVFAEAQRGGGCEQQDDRLCPQAR